MIVQVQMQRGEWADQRANNRILAERRNERQMRKRKGFRRNQQPPVRVANSAHPEMVLRSSVKMMVPVLSGEGARGGVLP
jgi:hypothetical protein